MNRNSFDTMTHQGVILSKAFEIITKIMYSVLQFPCSSKNNSRFHNADAHNSIMSLCLGNSYSESGLKRLAIQSGNNSPTGSWLRKIISKISQKTMLIQLHRSLDSTVSKLRELGVFDIPVTIAIDKHLIPKYDKLPNHFLIQSKSKNSTNHFESYCTMQCVEKRIRAQLGYYPLYHNKSNADFVRKLLSDGIHNGIKIKLLLVDREFFTTGIISVIKQKKLKFLMPAKKNSRIKDAILQYVNGNRESISPYTIKSASGHVESFTLVILPNKNARKKSNIIDQYVVFATNLTPKEISQNIQNIPTDYKKRWGIETGYAYVGRFRPKTTSSNQSIRLLYFYYSLILYNAWIIANLIISEECNVNNHKPIISIEILKYFFVKIIIEYFRNNKNNYFLECVT